MPWVHLILINEAYDLSQADKASSLIIRQVSD